MAVSYGALGVRAFKAAIATTDTITPALPSGSGAGQLIVFASGLQTATTFASNNGLVKTRQHERIAILEKTVTDLSLESAPTITFGAIVVGDLLSAVCLWFPGGTTSKDWNNGTGGAVTTLTPATLTVSDAGSVGIVFGHQPNDKTGASFTANSWTQQEYATSTVGSDATYYIANQDSLSTGAKTMPSWSWSGTLEWRSISFSVPPAGGGSTTNKTVSVAAATAVALARGAGKRIAVACADAIVLVRSIGKSVSATSSGLVVAKKAAAKSIAVGIVDAVSIAALRAVGVVITASAGSATTVRRAVGKGVSVAGTGAVLLRKAVGRAISIAAASASQVSASKAFLITIQAVVGSAETVGRQVGKGLSVTSAGLVSMLKRAGRAFAVTAASTVLIAKGITKPIGMILQATVSVLGARAFLVLVTVGAGLTVGAAKAVSRSVAGLGSTQTAVRKAVAASLGLTATAFITVIRGLSGGLFEFGQRVVRLVNEVRQTILGPRIATVAVGAREHVVASQAESRIVVLPPADRTVTVPAETRTTRTTEQ